MYSICNVQFIYLCSEHSDKLYLSSASLRICSLLVCELCLTCTCKMYLADLIYSCWIRNTIIFWTYCKIHMNVFHSFVKDEGAWANFIRTHLSSEMQLFRKYVYEYFATLWILLWVFNQSFERKLLYRIQLIEFNKVMLCLCWKMKVGLFAWNMANSYNYKIHHKFK